MKKTDRIYVAGHRGLVGQALIQALKAGGYTRLITRTRSELDLKDARAVRDFFREEQPEYVFLAAAKVGGIQANNSYPADFISDNLLIQCHVLQEAFAQKVKGLLFLGSSCIYPKYAEQPLREEALLTGPLEPTNQAYALAKIAGIEMCRAYNVQHQTRFLAVMPTNLYGSGDNFHLQNSHVIPALIRKFHEGKTRNTPAVEVWGSGTPYREFLHSRDMASACLFLMELPEKEKDIFLREKSFPLINIGSGEELTIRELAEKIKDITGYTGKIRWNTDQPDGTPRKLLESTTLRNLGWKPALSLDEGLREVCRWYSLREESKDK